MAYNKVCEDAMAAAEMRLLEHFKQHGGEVWSIGSGCQNCRQKVENLSGLKHCAQCNVALFCNRECQIKAWPTHKSECGVIATFFQLHKINDSDAKLSSLLSTLTFSSHSKTINGPKLTGIASSIGIYGPQVPGWFCTIDFEQASKEQQKVLYQAVLELYGLLKDDECWTRDKESFPRSSYTLIESLPHIYPAAKQLGQHFVLNNGHLFLFSAWLQHPEPPATQTMPLEDRSFFGILDSLLQIRTLREGVDAFMDTKSNS